MIQIGSTLVSDELLTEAFVCDLNACKGACCVEGEYGAPLTRDEANELAALQDQIAPYLSEEGKATIADQGAWVTGEDGDLETPLMPTGHCAYVIEDADKKLTCSLESVHQEGVLSFKKPVSCHLYPVRVQQYSSFEAINYHRWDICGAACALGSSLKVKVYVFVKEALVRKFGKEWYAALEKAAAELVEKK
ncbi:MAG: DUF3109 family protein [Flavobacteriaceae bacterium]